MSSSDPRADDPLSEAELKERINNFHGFIIHDQGVGLAAVRQCGDLLRIVKKRLEHNQWLPWLTVNFEGTTETAQRYMRISRHWDDLLAAEFRQNPALSIAAALHLIREHTLGIRSREDRRRGRHRHRRRLARKLGTLWSTLPEYDPRRFPIDDWNLDCLRQTTRDGRERIVIETTTRRGDGG